VDGLVLLLVVVVPRVTEHLDLVAVSPDVVENETGALRLLARQTS
jgi:hypothetical protein